MKLEIKELNHDPDELVTISECRRRIGGDRPTRQSIHDAINRKDLTKTPGPGRNIRLRWGDVRDYVDAGGFSLRRSPCSNPSMEAIKDGHGLFSDDQTGGEPNGEATVPSLPSEPSPDADHSANDAEPPEAVGTSAGAGGNTMVGGAIPLEDAGAKGNDATTASAPSGELVTNADFEITQSLVIEVLPASEIDINESIADDDRAPATLVDFDASEDCCMVLVPTDFNESDSQPPDADFSDEVIKDITDIESTISCLAMFNEPDLVRYITESADRAEALAQLTMNAASRALIFAWGTGVILRNVKDSRGHGSFISWVENNLPADRISIRTCQRYMKLAKEWPDVRELVKSQAGLTKAYIACGMIEERVAPTDDGNCSVATDVGADANQDPRLAGAFLKSLTGVLHSLQRLVDSDESLTPEQLNQAHSDLLEINRNLPRLSDDTQPKLPH